MEKLETEGRIPYDELFTVTVDTEKLTFTAVGKDREGRYILNVSSEYNIGSAYSSSEEYYVLSFAEVCAYAEQARKNGRLTRRACRKICAGE